MFKFTLTFLLFELLVATVNGADQNSLADVKSNVGDVQDELSEQQLLQSNIPPSQTDKCRRGFTYLPSTGSCYKVVYESHDWYSAGQRCHETSRSGSHLVAITSAEENSALKTFLATEVSRNLGNTACFIRGDAGAGYGYWTSGQQLVKKNCRSPFVWKLSSDKLLAFDYTNWKKDEPNCGNNGEFCVDIEVYNNFGWDDRWCTDKLCPLCEYTP